MTDAPAWLGAAYPNEKILAPSEKVLARNEKILVFSAGLFVVHKPVAFAVGETLAEVFVYGSRAGDVVSRGGLDRVVENKRGVERFAARGHLRVGKAFLQLDGFVHRKVQAVGVRKVNAEIVHVQKGGAQIGVGGGEFMALFHEREGLRPHFGKVVAFLRGKRGNVRLDEFQ